MSYKLRKRYWYYKVLQVAKRDLGLSDDDYRSVLEANGAKIKNGKISATTMSVSQLDAALDQLKKSGFTIKSDATDMTASMIAKCAAIWHQLYAEGAMRVPYSETALTNFAARLTNTNHIRWADVAGLRRVIEALKRIANREGVKLDG